jgi:hypothetical protein
LGICTYIHTVQYILYRCLPEEHEEIKCFRLNTILKRISVEKLNSLLTVDLFLSPVYYLLKGSSYSTPVHCLLALPCLPGVQNVSKGSLSPISPISLRFSLSLNCSLPPKSSLSQIRSLSPDILQSSSSTLCISFSLSLNCSLSLVVHWL